MANSRYREPLALNWIADGFWDGYGGTFVQNAPHTRASLSPGIARVSGTPDKILILGIGNILMGDEGVGIHAIRALEREHFPPHVDLLDGGTGGFHLLSYLQDFSRIVMIDATMDGKPPGTISVLRPRFASDFPRALTAHDIGLRDLVETAVLTHRLPEIHLMTVSIARIQNMDMELSADVSAALPRIAGEVRRILGTLDAGKGPSDI